MECKLFTRNKVTTVTVEVQRQAQPSVLTQQHWLCSGHWLWEPSRQGCHQGWQPGCATGNGCDWWHLSLPVAGIPCRERVALAAQPRMQLGSHSSSRKEEGTPGRVFGTPVWAEGSDFLGLGAALCCDSVTSPVSFSWLSSEHKASLKPFFFLCHWKLGLSDRCVCSKPSYFHQDLSGLLVVAVCVTTGFANQNPIFPTSLLWNFLWRICMWLT